MFLKQRVHTFDDRSIDFSFVTIDPQNIFVVRNKSRNIPVGQAYAFVFQVFDIIRDGIINTVDGMERISVSMLIYPRKYTPGH